MFLRKTFIYIILSFFSGFLLAQEPDHWESILQPGDPLTYLIPGNQVPADWLDLDFDDALWVDGIGGIGYGDDDDQTQIASTISVYMRYRFNVSDPDVLGPLVLDMDYDDGFVAYLNGVEVARGNMGAANSPVTYNQTADGNHEAQIWQGGLPDRFHLNENIVLNQGENVFTVQVHNVNSTSSDLSSSAFLHVGVKNSQSFYSSTPGWFTYEKPARFDSTLPIVKINTNGSSIWNDPRIVAAMDIIYNGEGQLNHPDDVTRHYSGRITIEVRGASSQMFPKKSYTLETQTPEGTNDNVSLLGMPSENDWVLYAPYSDKTLLRNVLSYRLYEEMGNWSPRTRFVDLYLNEEYTGIYVLTEKVKQDRNRVPIMSIDPTDVDDVDITGGYILQVDRTDGLASDEYWTSPVSPVISGFNKNHFEYYDPKAEDLTSQQAAYAKDWMNELDAVLASSSFMDEETGYRAYIDAKSFADYLIFHEFNKDVDAYRLSSFFYKANILNGGKLHAGPPWDYNLTYGNMDYGGNIRQTYNWMYTLTGGIYWWPRLISDPWFKNYVVCRWKEMRSSFLTEEKLYAEMDSSIQLLGNSVEQNFKKWPVIGLYVWPNYFIGDTYESEVDFVKNWVSERLDWIDSRWTSCTPMVSNEQIERPEADVVVFPNPSDFSAIRLVLDKERDEGLYLTLIDMQGRMVFQSSYRRAGSELQLEDLSHLPSGIYFLRISGEELGQQVLKLIRE